MEILSLTVVISFYIVGLQKIKLIKKSLINFKNSQVLLTMLQQHLSTPFEYFIYVEIAGKRLRSASHGTKSITIEVKHSFCLFIFRFCVFVHFVYLCEELN